MSGNLAAIIGAVGIVVFALVFAAGLMIVQEGDDRERRQP
jgi:xanthine/uracil permease